MICPLCTSPENSPVRAVAGRKFHRCTHCDLVFLDFSQRLTPAEEKARYELHNNDVNDPRYFEFTRPLYEEICRSVKPGASGLDFGAGTGPITAKALKENGYRVELYDLYFWPDPTPLQFQYDFVFACEVVEHFAAPATEFLRLRKLLKPDAPLVLMTLLHSEETDFSSWYYLKDPTHICAYSQRTFQWIAKNFGFHSCAFQSDRLIVLKLQ